MLDRLTTELMSTDSYWIGQHKMRFFIAMEKRISSIFFLCNSIKFRVEQVFPTNSLELGGVERAGVIVALERLVQREVALDHVSSEGGSSQRHSQAEFVARVANWRGREGPLIGSHDSKVDLIKWSRICRCALQQADPRVMAAH